MNFSKLTLPELAPGKVNVNTGALNLVSFNQPSTGTDQFSKMMNDRLYGQQATEKQPAKKPGDQQKTEEQRPPENKVQETEKQSVKEKTQSDAVTTNEVKSADDKTTSKEKNANNETHHLAKAQQSESTSESKKAATENEEEGKGKQQKTDSKKPVIQDVIIRETRMVETQQSKPEVKKAGEPEPSKKQAEQLAFMQKQGNAKAGEIEANTKNIKLSPQAKELIAATLKSQKESELSDEKITNILKSIKERGIARQAKAGIATETAKGDNPAATAFTTATVSRETSNDFKNLNFNQFSSLKGEDLARAEKFIDASSKKQSGDNQPFANLGQQAGNKAAFMGKTIDLPQLKAPLTQQFEAMMNKAKVVIRDKENARLTAQMYPRELGKVSLRLSLVEGALHGKFFVENEQVQKDLIARLEDIAAGMRADGFDISEFSVDVQSDRDGQPAQEPLTRQAQNKQANDSYLANQQSINEEGQYA